MYKLKSFEIKTILTLYTHNYTKFLITPKNLKGDYQGNVHNFLDLLFLVLAFVYISIFTSLKIVKLDT